MKPLLPLMLCLGSWAVAQVPLKQVAPADRQAYEEAQKQRDPELRIAALEKAFRDFPDSALLKRSGIAMLLSARENLFVKSLKEQPGSRQKAMALAKKLINASPGISKAKLSELLARALLDQKLYPKDALRLAKASLAALEASPDGQSDLPQALLTTGRAYLASRKPKPAAASFEKALQRRPELSAAALEMSALASAQRQPERALSYLAQARLLRPSAELNTRFDSAFRALNGDSVAARESYLDQRYAQIYPPQKHTPPSTPISSGRAVFAEVHTGAGCPPCVAADLAFDAMLEEFSRRQLIVVMYHQHIPRPDPLANDDSAALWAERKGRGVPTYLIDGISKIGGGGRKDVAGMTTSLRKQIEERLTQTPQANLRLTATRSATAIQVGIDVAGVSADVPAPRLRLALVEKLVRYSGENGIRFHPYVARTLTTLPATQGHLEHSFGLAQLRSALSGHIERFETKNERHNPDGKFRFLERKDSIDEAQLAVVAYLEDEKGVVLQAAYADLQ